VIEQINARLRTFQLVGERFPHQCVAQLPHWCSIALSLLNNPDCFNPLYEKQSKPSTPIEYPKAVSKPAGLVSSERDIPNHVNPQWHKENNSSAERREKANNLLKQLTSQEYKLDTSDYQKFRLLKQGTKEWEDIRPGRASGTSTPNLWGTPGYQVSVREQYKRIFEGKKPKTSQFVQKNFARGHRVEEHVKAIIPEIFKTTFGVNVVAKETGSYLAPQDFTFGLDPDAFKDSGYSPEKFLASPDIIIDLDPGDEGITTETTTEDNNSANDYENDADSDCDSGDNNKEKPTSTEDNNSDSDNENDADSDCDSGDNNKENHVNCHSDNPDSNANDNSSNDSSTTTSSPTSTTSTTTTTTNHNNTITTRITTVDTTVTTTTTAAHTTIATTTTTTINATTTASSKLCLCEVKAPQELYESPPLHIVVQIFLQCFCTGVHQCLLIAALEEPFLFACWYFKIPSEFFQSDTWIRILTTVHDVLNKKKADDIPNFKSGEKKERKEVVKREMCKYINRCH
jgi:hypothetical protein